MGNLMANEVWRKFNQITLFKHALRTNTALILGWPYNIQRPELFFQSSVPNLVIHVLYCSFLKTWQMTSYGKGGYTITEKLLKIPLLNMHYFGNFDRVLTKCELFVFIYPLPL